MILDLLTLRIIMAATCDLTLPNTKIVHFQIIGLNGIKNLGYIYKKPQDLKTYKDHLVSSQKFMVNNLI